MAAVTAAARPGVNSLVRNALALIFSTTASAALGMVFWLVAAHLFDTDTVGRASQAVSSIALLSGLAQVVPTSVYLRFLPSAGVVTRRFLGLGYAATTAAAVVLTTGYFAVGLGRNFGHGLLVVLGFAVAVVGNTFLGIQDAVLTSLRRATWVPVKNIGIALAKLALLPAMLVTAVGSPVLVAWIVPAVLALLVVSAPIFGRLAPRQAWASGRRHQLPNRRVLASFVGAEYLTMMLAALFGLLPPVLVAYALGPTGSALFYIPWLIGVAVENVIWNIVMSFVVEATSDPGQIRSHVRRAVRLGLLITVGGGAVLAAGAPLLLGVVGHDYAVNGVTTLRLIALSLPCTGTIAFYFATSLMAKKAWTITSVRFVATGILAVVTLPALHRFGLNGAAGTFLLTQAAMALTLLPAVLHRYRTMSSPSTGDAPTEVLDMREILAAVQGLGSHQETWRAGRAAVRGIAAVPRAGFGTDVGSVRVVFVPDLVQWSTRMAHDPTVVLERITDDDTLLLTPLAEPVPVAGAARHRKEDRADSVERVPGQVP